MANSKLNSDNQTQIPLKINAKGFQDEIRKAVKNYNWYYECSEVERKLKVSQFSQWLKGNRNYSMQKLILIANQFKIPIKVRIGKQDFELKI